MDEIIHNLWLGDIKDAIAAPSDFVRICVLETLPPQAAPNTTHIPILTVNNGIVEAMPTQLMIAARLISRLLSSGCKVLVHCMAGVERSPLTVVWYLYKECGMSFDDAYKFVVEKRPIVQDRRAWLSGRLL